MQTLWLLVALLLLILAIWKPAKSAIIGGLDNRAERIRRELDDAKRLHEEAKALLAKHQGQLEEGNTHAEQIVAQAKEEASRMESRMREDFETLTMRRRQQAEERIAEEEARAVRDVRRRAADLAARTTRKLITERMDGDVAQATMRDAISEVQRKLA